MGSGFRTFASGEVLTAANVNNYLMEQAVMSFADSTARDAAVTSPEEGMTAYLQDTNSITVYSGSAWVTIADLDVLVVDSANSRVGIGTSTPNTPLTVSHSGTYGLSLVTSDAYSYLVLSDNTTTAYNYVGIGALGDDLKMSAGGAIRMTINSSGKVGIAATSPQDLFDVGDGSTTGSFRVHAGSGSESFRVASTIVRSASIVATTTGTAANVFINAGNNTLYMSTSSLKYKTDVETMEDAYADAILELRPVWYRSLGPDDPDTWSYWGFIAEEVAEIDPRLVTFTVPADYERQYDEDGEPINPDVKDLTEPDGVQYDRLVPHLVNLLSRQRDQIADLTARIEALENT